MYGVKHGKFIFKTAEVCLKAKEKGVRHVLISLNGVELQTAGHVPFLHLLKASYGGWSQDALLRKRRLLSWGGSTLLKWTLLHLVSTFHSVMGGERMVTWVFL